MLEQSLQEIGSAYQEKNPEKIVLYKIPFPFDITRAKLVFLDEISASYLTKGETNKVEFYDDDSLIRVRKITLSRKGKNNYVEEETYTDYYLFNREAYEKLRYAMTSPEGEVVSSSLLCGCGKRTPITYP